MSKNWKMKKTIGVMALFMVFFTAIIAITPTVSAAIVLAPPWGPNYACDNTQPSSVTWHNGNYVTYNWIVAPYCTATTGFVGAYMSATAYGFGDVTMNGQPGLRLLNWRAPSTGYLPVTANWHLHTGVNGDATYGHQNTVDVSVKIDLKIVFTDRTTGGSAQTILTNVYVAQLVGGQKWTTTQVNDASYSVTVYANMNRGDSITVDTWVIIHLLVDGGSIIQSQKCSGSVCMKSDNFYGGWLTSVVIG